MDAMVSSSNFNVILSRGKINLEIHKKHEFPKKT